MGLAQRSPEHSNSVWLAPTVKEAIAYYASVHSSNLSDEALHEAKRMLACGDLFYLMVYVLKRHDLLHPWLFDRCREVQAKPDGCIDLWAREHRKTSIISVGLTIFDIINDPEITIGLFSHTRPIAKSILRLIKREFETNEDLKGLFPDIFYENPEKESPKWSEDGGIIVKRTSNPRECTLEAHGLVDGMPTGLHFKRLVYDDIVTRESVSTPEQVAKTTEALELSDNLGVEGGAKRFIGTRYAIHDSYSSVLKKGVAVPRLHPATHNGKMDGKPVLFTQEEWNRRKQTQSRQIVAAQLLQNPLADEDATFRAEWLRSWAVRPKTLNIGILCDPSRGRNAESDNTAIAVIGISSSGAKYLLDGFCHRMTLSQRWTNLRDLYLKWSRMDGVQLVWVGYERYGAQSDDEYFQERMMAEKDKAGHKISFVINELNWPREGGNSKRDRVERLEPEFRNSRFYLPLSVWHDGKPRFWKVDLEDGSKTYGSILYRDVDSLTRVQQEALDGGAGELICKAIRRVNSDGKMYDLTDWFISEYLSFPFGEYKDLIDATSRIYDLELKPPNPALRAIPEPKTHWDE